MEATTHSTTEAARRLAEHHDLVLADAVVDQSLQVGIARGGRRHVHENVRGSVWVQL